MSYKLKDYMQDIVGDMVPSIVRDLGYCNCERCTLDTVAISLNNLPSMYLVKLEGEPFAKGDFVKQELSTKLISIIATAANVVKANPRH